MSVEKMMTHLEHLKIAQGFLQSAMFHLEACDFKRVGLLSEIRMRVEVETVALKIILKVLQSSDGKEKGKKK